MGKRKLKYGQLFTCDNHVYQVRKTPKIFLGNGYTAGTCAYCRHINKNAHCFDCIIPNFNCADLTPIDAHLKLIK